MLSRYLFAVTIPLALLLVGLPVAVDRHTGDSAPRRIVDDFEGYAVNGLPTSWKFLDANKDVVFVRDEHMYPDERFVVMQERGNKFVRARAKDGVARIIMPTREEFVWDLRDNSVLRWDWRALSLPDGADETNSKLNDTGGAVYVVFGFNRLFGPRMIKYTYSSTLPVGTVSSFNFGRMKVIVASSGEDGYGDWVTVTRDVVADYEAVFRGSPPENPESIMLWSDSDNTGVLAEVDFDNIVVE